MPDSYQQIRERVNAEIRELERKIRERRLVLGYIDELEANDATASPVPSRDERGASSSKETWADAISRVMRVAGKPITLAEIRTTLEAEGRLIPSGAKGSNQIRNTIFRNKDQRGYKRVGTRGNRALWTVNGSAEGGEV